MGGHNLEDYETLHVLKEGPLHFTCHLDTSEAQISALSDALQTAKSGDEEKNTGGEEESSGAE